MEPIEAAKILAMVKGNWYRQPADDPTIAVWADTLAEVDYRDAAAAVRAYIAAGDSAIPTVGAIRKLAVEMTVKRRDSVRKLPWPEPTEAEREEGKRILREAIASIGKGVE